MTKAGGFFTAMAAAAVLVAAIPSAAPAASSNDGNWSVTIITQAGNCPSTLRYGVRVAGGRVFADGQAPGQRHRGAERCNPRDGFRTGPIRQRAPADCPATRGRDVRPPGHPERRTDYRA